MRGSHTVGDDVVVPREADSFPYKVSGESFAGAALQHSSRIFAIQFRNKTGADLGGTDRFAFVSVSAIAETFSVHHLHHFEDATFAFGVSLRQQREMRDFRRSEEHG